MTGIRFSINILLVVPFNSDIRKSASSNGMRMSELDH